MKVYRAMLGTALPINATTYGYSGSVQKALNKAITDFGSGSTATLYEITVKPVRKVKIKQVVESLPMSTTKAKSKTKSKTVRS